MKKTLCTAYALIVLVALFAVSCSDDPDEAARSLGLGLISPDDVPKTDSLVITANADTNFRMHVNTSGTVLVGKYKDIEARSLIQFVGFTQIPASAVIDSAVVTIGRNYSFLDSSGQLAYTVHELLSGWNQTTFTWDSAQASGLYTTASEATVNTPVTADDTTMNFRIDGLVRRWVSSSTNGPNGIILLPVSNFSDFITGTRSVSGQENRPLLTVSYRDSLDSLHTFSARSSQSITVSSAGFSPSPGMLLVESGVSFRALLRFDSLAIPKRVSITQALLDIPADASQGLLNGFSRDSVLVYLSRKNEVPFDSLVLGTYCSPVLSPGGKLYRADIKTLVQLWVTREPNNGLVIVPSNEVSSFDRFVLYGASAPLGQKPTLTVRYTILP